MQLRIDPNLSKNKLKFGRDVRSNALGTYSKSQKPFLGKSRYLGFMRSGRAYMKACTLA